MQRTAEKYDTSVDGRLLAISLVTERSRESESFALAWFGVISLVVISMICSRSTAAERTERKPEIETGRIVLLADLDPDQPVADQIEQFDIDNAIAIANLAALDRIEKAARMRPLYDSIISTEMARVALRDSIRRAINTTRDSDQSGSFVRNVSASSRRHVRTASLRNAGQTGVINDAVVKLMRRKKLSIDTEDGNRTQNLSVPTAIANQFDPIVIVSPPAKTLSSKTSRTRVAIGVTTDTVADAEPSELALGDRDTADAPSHVDSNAQANAGTEEGTDSGFSQQHESYQGGVTSNPYVERVVVAQLPVAASDNSELSDQLVDSEAGESVMSTPQDGKDPEVSAAEESDAATVRLLETNPLFAAPPMSPSRAPEVQEQIPSEEAPKLVQKDARTLDESTDELVVQHPSPASSDDPEPAPIVDDESSVIAIADDPAESEAVELPLPEKPPQTDIAAQNDHAGALAEREKSQPSNATSQEIPIPRPEPLADPAPRLTEDEGTISSVAQSALSPPVAIEKMEAELNQPEKVEPVMEAPIVETLPGPKSNQKVASELQPPEFIAPTSTGITLSVNEVDVRTVFEMLAKSYDMSILVAPEVSGTVTANVTDLTPQRLLNSVVRLCGLSTQMDNGVILIYSKQRQPNDSLVLRRFPLSFARSEVVAAVVEGLLSPVGKVFASEVDHDDPRRGIEEIVVIDSPDVLAHVERYLMQADQPPQQVVIDAHVLEIKLCNGNSDGIDLQQVFGRGCRMHTLECGQGFSNSDIPPCESPGYCAEVSGPQIIEGIELLKSTLAAKTLASTRLMVVNGQSARFLAGKQLGYAVDQQHPPRDSGGVRYRDTGVSLRVIPTIAQDGRVLLHVNPKVSCGKINPHTLLPDETTREVETAVLLNNHQGMLIGGLIQETNVLSVQKTPLLGNLPRLGKHFQHRYATVSRSEIVIALVPHVVQLDVVESDCLMGY